MQMENDQLLKNNLIFHYFKESNSPCTEKIQTIQCPNHVPLTENKVIYRTIHGRIRPVRNRLGVVN